MTTDITEPRNICEQKKVVLKWVQKGNTAASLRSFSGTTLLVFERFDKLVKILEKIHDISLPRHVFPLSNDMEKTVKQFCGGLLEPCPHRWKPILRRRDLRTRVSIGGSIFLFRKVIASAEKPNRLAYAKSMSRPQPRASPGYRRHVRDMVSDMFPRGWDRGWAAQVEDFTLPTSSCLSNSKKKGGARGEYLEEKGLDDLTVARFFEGDPDFRIDPRVRPSVVWAGKWRLVTVASSSRSLLGPLHNLLYNRLSKFDWLLRGEADPKVFSGFEREKGEVFVSGDFESATDHLLLEISRLILQTATRNCQYVPRVVVEAGIESLVSQIEVDGVVFEQRRGQLMGNLLSFPLLCLHNYLSFKYAIPRGEVPVRINGDDIVFRARPDEVESWFKLVGSLGLVVSIGKTLVSGRVFSLNSSFFITKFSALPQLIPFVRSTCLFQKADGPEDLVGKLTSVVPRSAVGWRNARVIPQAYILEKNRSVIYRAQRSIRRGLGCDAVSRQALTRSGMWTRECFYNSLPRETHVPLRGIGWRQNAIPEGWHRVRVEVEDLQQTREFISEVIELAWSKKPESRTDEDENEYWGRVRAGTFRFTNRSRSDLSRLARLLGKSTRFTEDYLRSDVPVTRKEVGKLVWVKECGPQEGIQFRLGSVA